MKTLILDYLEETAARLPDKTAFADPDSSVTFAALLRGARAVASALLGFTQPRMVLGFYMDKSVAALVGFMGAVYAGCAYAPLNLRHPAARILSILDTLDAPVVITDRAHLAQLEAMQSGRTLLCVEDLLEHEEDAAGLAAIRRGMIDVDPLYVNFTSGSTGTPKGVVVGHRSVLDFIRCFTEIFSITEGDVLANQAPFDFDVSVKDIYSGILTGATVAIVPTAYFTQPVKLMDFLCDHGATVMVWAVAALCIASAYHVLSPGRLQSVRQVLFSGEVIPRKHLDAWLKCLPNARFVNLYGPTEITCNCLYHVVDRTAAYPQGLPLGKSFGHCEVLLLDEADQLVTEPGKLGELVVRGPSVALGYVGNPEATARSFVQNPLNSMYHDRVYRTGDLAERLDSGDLVFRGRRDNQIKYMGHRIELEEVDKAFEDLPGVQRCRCAFDARRQRLHVFFEGTAEEAALPRLVADTLPASMRPSSITRVDSMPLNKNGKVDRVELLRTYFPTKSKEGR